MSHHQSIRMPFEYDIVVDAADHTRTLIVECKRMRETSDAEAARFRQNLARHERALRDAYFMLVLPTKLFLWVPSAALDAPPDFTAPARTVLATYLGRWADQPGGPLSESLAIAISSWLSDLLNGIREPDPQSEPDRMMVQSGLLIRIKGGSVRTQVAA